MKPTPAAIAKLVGIALGAAASAWAGASTAHSDHKLQLEALIEKVDKVAGDVRLLKCNAGFPGDCPGQATISAEPRRAR